IARLGLRHEDFPEPIAAHTHGMAAAVPEIEIADHTDALGIRDEHHKGHAGYAVERHRVRTELVVELEVIAFAQEIEIEVGQHGRKAVGILNLDHALPEARPQMIAG